MKAVGVLPARWASTRLPGKVLVDIAGKSMLQRVWEQACQCRRLDRVIIACDERHVQDCARAFGAEAVLTRKDHLSGSDRIAEAVADVTADIVINIQADEPFIDPALIDGLVLALEKDPAAMLATPVKEITEASEMNDPNVVKAVVDVNWNALYFSRAAIPFHRDGVRSGFSRCYRHLGLYAYRRDFLFEFCRWPKGYLEQEECLEQLRVLEAGYRIRCVLTDTVSIGVDTPEDVRRAVEYAQTRNL